SYPCRSAVQGGRRAERRLYLPYGTFRQPGELQLEGDLCAWGFPAALIPLGQLLSGSIFRLPGRSSGWQRQHRLQYHSHPSWADGRLPSDQLVRRQQSDGGRFRLGERRLEISRVAEDGHLRG